MEALRRVLQKVVEELFGLEDFAVDFSETPVGVEGEVACNVAMKLAKVLKKNPREIAMSLVKKMEEELPEYTFTVAGAGFINVSFPNEYYTEKIERLAADFERETKIDDYKGQVVLCEFSDPNPFKVLHVGHLYTSVVGDAIARLYEFAGAEVKRLNFGGDVGLHVAKTMYEILRREDFLHDEALGLDEKAEKIGECYVAGTRAYEEDEKACAEITKINKEIYRIAEEDLHDSKLAQWYWLGREISYEYFKRFYASVGLVFDKYYPESMTARVGLEKVREELAKGVYEKSDGAVVFKGEKYGLHTRVFINKEGVPTYEAKDVGLVLMKWADWRFDESIIITGSEQLEYMQVVYKSIEQFEPELAKRTKHLTHGMVRLPGDEKMSSRKGNFLKAVDTIKTIEENLCEISGSTDEKVVMGATKYAFLKYKMGGNIVFDVKESVSTAGNSGVYLQYSAVRANKILGKLDEKVPEDEKWELNENERKLAKKMFGFREILKSALENQAPYKLCNYLYELAQEFSRFYEHEQVIGAEREVERGVLIRIYAKTLTLGLELLGIKVPEEM